MVPGELKKMKHLKMFHISGSGLQIFPQAVLPLTHLEVLDIGFNAISSIPDIEPTNGLRTLTLIGNPITEWSTTITGMKNLTHIDVAPSQLCTLPDGMQAALMTKFPSYIQESQRVLQSISKYTQIENYVDIDFVTSITIENKPLKRIPEAIFELPKLRSLRIIYCGLQDIQCDFQSLPMLKSLHLHSNQISVIPDSIGQLQELEEIVISNNAIKELPESMAQLKNLKILKIHNNQIQKISPAILELPLLKVLDISNNPLIDIPRDVAAVVLQFFCKIGFYAKTHIWLKTEGRVSVQTG